MKVLLFTRTQTANPLAQAILALKDGVISELTLDSLNLSLPKQTPPKGTPSERWRKACEPLVEALDCITDLDAIIVFDLPALRTLTGARVPRAPILWVGPLNTRTLPLYAASALRLTLTLLLPPNVDPQAVISACRWQEIDSHTRPTLASIPTTSTAWQTLLSNLPKASPTLPARLEHALLDGTLQFLGGGSRRLCYQLQETGLCIKTYRRPQDFLPTTKDAVRKEITRYAHSRTQNTSCQEYDYLQTIRCQQPDHLVALFPEYVDLLYLPSFGWSLIETMIQNADGTSAQHFFEILNANTRNPAIYRPLVAKVDALVDELCEHALPFYDFQNILTQYQPDGSYRLRIADFEPRARQLIPLDVLFPGLRRRKMRRRYARTYQNTIFPLIIETNSNNPTSQTSSCQSGVDML